MALNPAQLKRIEETIQADIERGDYDGVNVIIAQHGEIALQGTYGFAERATERPSRQDDIYRVLSLSKAFTNALAYRALGEGKLALSTRVVEVVPEFLGTDPFRMMRKDKINLWNLLTHTSGMPATPNPGMPIQDCVKLPEIATAIGTVDVIHEPGTQVNYSPAINHALIGEMVRRAYGYDSFQDMARELIFEPLGMKDTAFGLSKENEDRAVPIKAYVPDTGFLRPEDIEGLNEVITEEAELPWVGATTTVDDVFKFVEMLRRKGEVNGEQLIGKAIIEQATTLQTGDMMNDLYTMVNSEMGWAAPKGNIGLGVILSGTGPVPNFFGPFTSPNAFGNNGAGSTL
ncbi:serine hydrolase, partial [uncultured Corynebacterium sp.]|uniref:serine hydrolase domain-containing protein n=1 Tax=uncultured Corynebacterium sp. TaxID=159447 RepID=UPI0025DB3BAC